MSIRKEVIPTDRIWLVTQANETLRMLLAFESGGDSGIPKELSCDLERLRNTTSKLLLSEYARGPSHDQIHVVEEVYDAPANDYDAPPDAAECEDQAAPGAASAVDHPA